MNIVAAVLVQTQRLPWGAMILSAIAVLLGILLLVYFVKRLKKTDKQVEEEDWNSARHTLFGVTPAPPQRGTPAAGEASPAVTAGTEVQEPAAAPRVAAKIDQPVTEPASPPRTILPTETVAFSSETPSRETKVLVSEPAGREDSRTRQLASLTPADAGHAQTAGSPFEDDIWAELEREERPASTAAAPIEEPAKARPAPELEPYEPPRIELIQPGSGTSARQPWADKTEKAGSEPISTAAPILPPLSVAAERSLRPEAHLTRPEARVVESPEAVPAAIGHPASQHSRKSAGSILGLPAEASAGPMVLGERRAADHPDVGTIANYGKEADDGGGHGGTIALMTVLLIIAGAVLAYFLVPSLHSSVNLMIAKAKGDAPVERTKAQVFAERMDSTKNPVEAKGAVQNISDETLNDLFVEVSLEPIGSAPADTRSLPISPSQLPPGGQGTYSFELDAKLYKGYRVGKLVTKNGVEVKSTIANQQK